MMPACTKGGGQAMGFPDVCKVPAPPAPFIPTPFPNIGMLNQGSKFSTKVKIKGKAAGTTKTEMSRSQGDEAGTLGGMVSAVNMNKIAFKKGSSKVKIQGKPAVYLTAMTAHNGSNANMPAGAVIAPGQTDVLVVM